jgi:hypothetical protein
MISEHNAGNRVFILKKIMRDLGGWSQSANWQVPFPNPSYARRTLDLVAIRDDLLKHVLKAFTFRSLIKNFYIRAN